MVEFLDRTVRCAILRALGTIERRAQPIKRPAPALATTTRLEGIILFLCCNQDQVRRNCYFTTAGKYCGQHRQTETSVRNETASASGPFTIRKPIIFVAYKAKPFTEP